MAKEKQEFLHPTYTGAINAALKRHEHLKVSDDDLATNIGSGPRKPGVGKTVSHHLPAVGPTGTHHLIHVQVYNTGSQSKPYEVNSYASRVPGPKKTVKESRSLGDRHEPKSVWPKDKSSHKQEGGNTPNDQRLKMVNQKYDRLVSKYSKPVKEESEAPVSISVRSHYAKTYMKLAKKHGAMNTKHSQNLAYGSVEHRFGGETLKKLKKWHEDNRTGANDKKTFPNVKHYNDDGSPDWKKHGIKEALSSKQIAPGHYVKPVYSPVKEIPSVEKYSHPKKTWKEYHILKNSQNVYRVVARPTEGGPGIGVGSLQGYKDLVAARKFVKGITPGMKLIEASNETPDIQRLGEEPKTPQKPRIDYVGKSKAMHDAFKAIDAHPWKEKSLKKEAKKDPGEYDYEGDMAMSQLKSIMMNAKRLHDCLEPETNLPEWVQSKITLAEDYITTATNYVEGTLDEEVEITEVLSKDASATEEASFDPSLNKKDNQKVLIEKGKKKADLIKAALHKKKIMRAEEGELTSDNDPDKNTNNSSKTLTGKPRNKIITDPVQTNTIGGGVQSGVK